MMTMTMTTSLTRALFAAAVLAGVPYGAAAEELHTFTRRQLNDQFWSEGANFGDLNRDGCSIADRAAPIDSNYRVVERVIDGVGDGER